MHLQEGLQVQVGDLILVADTEQLSEGGVGEDSALERRIEAAMGLHILADELRDLRLGALGARGKTHKGGQLIRKGTLDQERIVRTTGLPLGLLLRRHRGGILPLLLLGIAGLLLRLLGRLLDVLDRLTNTARELGAKGLELLTERGQDRIGGEGCLGGHNGRHRCGGSQGGDGHNRLGGDGGLGGLGGSGGLGGGGGHRGGGRGLGGLLRGLLLNSHLV